MGLLWYMVSTGFSLWNVSLELILTVNHNGCRQLLSSRPTTSLKTRLCHQVALVGPNKLALIPVYFCLPMSIDQRLDERLSGESHSAVVSGQIHDVRPLSGPLWMRRNHLAHRHCQSHRRDDINHDDVTVGWWRHGDDFRARDTTDIMSVVSLTRKSSPDRGLLMRKCQDYMDGIGK